MQAYLLGLCTKCSVFSLHCHACMLSEFPYYIYAPSLYLLCLLTAGYVYQNYVIKYNSVSIMNSYTCSNIIHNQTSAFETWFFAQPLQNNYPWLHVTQSALPACFGMVTLPLGQLVVTVSFVPKHCYNGGKSAVGNSQLLSLLERLHPPTKSNLVWKGKIASNPPISKHMVCPVDIFHRGVCTYS